VLCLISVTSQLIIPLEARLQPNVEKHFIVCFDGVHAFGYNSAESEPIWMKSGAFSVHSLELLLADFGHDLRSSKSWRARRNFVSFVR